MLAECRLAVVAAAVILAVPVSGWSLDSGQLASELLSEPLERLTTKNGLVGLASYYASRFNGRKTQSGAVHDPDELTAAHPTLPFGTRVVVRNLVNDREVVVTVNDRCRKKKMPFIDLSRAAARRLGFLGLGTTRVKILPLPPKEAARMVARNVLPEVSP